MNTKNDVKNWYLNDSFNSKNSAGTITDYRIACVISPSTATYLSFKNEPNQLYLGSNIQVIVNGQTISYKLLYYSYRYDSINKKYLVGKATYNLKDIKFDYKNYINSKEYLYIAIGPANIENNTINFTQAILYNNNYSNESIIFTNENYTYKGAIEFLTSSTKTTYSANNVYYLQNKFSNTPNTVFKYISRTPSTQIFADNIPNNIIT